jgi:hypothetical protein
MSVPQSTKILGEPLNLAEQEQGNCLPFTAGSSLIFVPQDAAKEHLAEKAASEASVDDTILDEPAPTESSDGGK